MQTETGKKSVFAAIMILCVALASGFAAEKKLTFPDFRGWTAPQKPAEYTPDNLYEYINGAAEVFHAYNFRHLLSGNYTNSKDQTITVDIYRHEDLNSGFGIYSQEKPENGPFMNVGTQGYYEEGILNFFKGRFYVKISAFDLGSKDREILSALAGQLDAAIPDKAEFPAVLALFPKNNLKAHSFRYIHSNFLGHSFLKTAFTADYHIRDQDYQVFILCGKNPEDISGQISAYRSFARKKGMDIEETDHAMTWTDPYYKSKGPLMLSYSGSLAWGMFSRDPQIARRMVKDVRRNLDDKKIKNVN